MPRSRPGDTSASTPLPVGRRTWWPVAAVLLAVAWGGNEFTPLLVMYREQGVMGPVTVDALLCPRQMKLPHDRTEGVTFCSGPRMGRRGRRIHREPSGERLAGQVLKEVRRGRTKHAAEVVEGRQGKCRCGEEEKKKKGPTAHEQNYARPPDKFSRQKRTGGTPKRAAGSKNNRLYSVKMNSTRRFLS